MSRCCSRPSLPRYEPGIRRPMVPAARTADSPRPSVHRQPTRGRGVDMTDRRGTVIQSTGGTSMVEFVGRARELVTLGDLMREAAGSRPDEVMPGGESG